MKRKISEVHAFSSFFLTTNSQVIPIIINERRMNEVKRNEEETK